MNKPKRTRVFFSYAQADAALARKIHRVIESSTDARIFSDQDFPVGGDWGAELRKQMISADLVVLLLTPNGIRSEWVLQELGAAWGLDKPMLTLVTRKQALRNVPMQFREQSIVEIDDFETTEEADRFIRAFDYNLASVQQR